MKLPKFTIKGRNVVDLINLVIRWLGVRLLVASDKTTREILFVGIAFPLSPLRDFDLKIHSNKLKILFNVNAQKNVQKSAQNSVQESVRPPDLLITIPVVAPAGSSQTEIVDRARPFAVAELELVENQLYRSEIAWEVVPKEPQESYSDPKNYEVSKTYKAKYGSNFDANGMGHYLVNVWGYFKSPEAMREEKKEIEARGEKYDYQKEIAKTRHPRRP